ncbi:MAG: hypothetical protein QM658_05100 [Gordonia sp. (in: high G+C Gram-positive bacteria)]
MSVIRDLLADVAFRFGEVDSLGLADAMNRIEALDVPRSEVIPEVFRWMEEHGHQDLGTPGAAVHYLEDAEDYRPALEASWARKPIAHTAWMINRIANGQTDESGLRHWIDLLGQAQSHPLADDVCKQQAADFIALHTGR